MNLKNLKREVEKYHAARNCLLRRASEIRDNLEHVREVLGPELWSSIPGAEVLEPQVGATKGRRGRPIGDKNRRLRGLLKDGPKSKRELARLMNTTLVDLDRVIYGPSFTRQGRMFSLANG